MVDPRVLVALVLAAAVWLAGVEVVKGVKAIGHGAKIAACKLHVARCAPKEPKP